MSKNIEHIRYKKITENSDYFYFISSNSLEEDIYFIQTNEIENICLSQYEGYDLENILPIIDLKNIKKLRIYVEKIDLVKINVLENLEELSIGEKFINLNLNNLNNLKSLYLVHGTLTGLNNLKKLKELIIINGESSFFSESNFKQNSSIEVLSIYGTKGVINFSFLRNLKNLKELDLYNVKSELDIRLLESSASKLETLKIEKCKIIIHFEEFLPNFKSLRYLSLVDSVPVSNAETLLNLKSLEVLVVLGKSFFIDGNINQLNKIKHVSIDNKKHYSLKNEQFSKLPIS
jgi:hypothetical protein